jgi:hypothetical protein
LVAFANSKFLINTSLDEVEVTEVKEAEEELNTTADTTKSPLE